MTGFPQRANSCLREPQTTEVQRSLGYRGSMRLRRVSALLTWDCTEQQDLMQLQVAQLF